MKTKDYLETLPVRSVVTDKRALALFKRMGFIYDYSKWGYLESCWADFTESDGYSRHEISYAPVPENMTESDWRNKLHCGHLSFTYKGVEFGIKYLDGCFNAYLCKTGGIVGGIKLNVVSNPRMSLYGNII